MFLYILKKEFIWFICTKWCGSSDVLLLGSKQELVFWHLLHVLVIERTFQDKLYIQCSTSPLSRLAGLMVMRGRVRDHVVRNERNRFRRESRAFLKILKGDEAYR